MNITKLSAYLEEFLALKRTMAEAGPNYDAFDRRSLRHKEKLLRSFLVFCGITMAVTGRFVRHMFSIGGLPRVIRSIRTEANIVSIPCGHSYNRCALPNLGRKCRGNIQVSDDSMQTTACWRSWNRSNGVGSRARNPALDFLLSQRVNKYLATSQD